MRRSHAVSSGPGGRPPTWRPRPFERPTDVSRSKALVVVIHDAIEMTDLGERLGLEGNVWPLGHLRKYLQEIRLVRGLQRRHEHRIEKGDSQSDPCDSR